MKKITYYKQGKLDIRRTVMNRVQLYGRLAIQNAMTKAGGEQ